MSLRQSLFYFFLFYFFFFSFLILRLESRTNRVQPSHMPPPVPRSPSPRSPTGDTAVVLGLIPKLNQYAPPPPHTAPHPRLQRQIWEAGRWRCLQRIEQKTVSLGVFLLLFLCLFWDPDRVQPSIRFFFIHFDYFCLFFSFCSFPFSWSYIVPCPFFGFCALLDLSNWRLILASDG